MFMSKHRGFPGIRGTDGNVTGLTGKGLYGIVERGNSSGMKWYG